MRDSAQVTSSGAINSMIAAMSTRPNRQNRSTCSRISVSIALTPPPPCEPVHMRCAPMRRTRAHCARSLTKRAKLFTSWKADKDKARRKDRGAPKPRAPARRPGLSDYISSPRRGRRFGADRKTCAALRGKRGPRHRGRSQCTLIVLRRRAARRRSPQCGRGALPQASRHPIRNRKGERAALRASMAGVAAKESNAMTTITTPSSLALVPSLETAWQDVDSSFERFCLTAGIGAIEQMLCEDAQQLAGAPHNRSEGRVGRRWGRTKGKMGFHGGKVAVHRPRVRSYDGHEVALPTWRTAQAEDWLGRWAMNLMLINVSTRKLRRAVRLPEGDLPVIAGDGTSK